MLVYGILLWSAICHGCFYWMFLLENGRNQTCISGDFIAQTSGNDAWTLQTATFTCSSKFAYTVCRILYLNFNKESKIRWTLLLHGVRSFAIWRITCESIRASTDLARIDYEWSLDWIGFPTDVSAIRTRRYVPWNVGYGVRGTSTCNVLLPLYGVRSTSIIDETFGVQESIVSKSHTIPRVNNYRKPSTAKYQVPRQRQLTAQIPCT